MVTHTYAFKFLTAILLTFAINKNNFCCNQPFVSSILSHSGSSSLESLSIDGKITFENTQKAARDFGNMHSYSPSAILFPKSVSDISSLIKHVFQMGDTSALTIAARGHGHSLQGQAQAHQGVVINMESFIGNKMEFYKGEVPYVDVSAGELWINILNESLKHGLAPRSWTDYLYLTVGGTLSNAGISGQAFRHGPQIYNVHQLEVVTGKGEIVSCSEKENPDLFNGVLGGLGQFGIITRARIALEPAPKMVRWIRMLYADFFTFTNDQEHLISCEDPFDYIEGFVIKNRTGLLNNWRTSFKPKDPVRASSFNSDGKTLYCLEIAKYFNPDDIDSINQKIESSLSKLSYIQSTLFLSDVSYMEFLDRVHVGELKLREKGLWDVPHPWLNLMIPKSSIYRFAEEVFGRILKDTSNGPILIYPVNKSKWNNRTSLVTPEQDLLYLVAFLHTAIPQSTGTDGVDYILTQNRKVLAFCEKAKLGVKQYLPHYTTEKEWQAHFGHKWDEFIRRKSAYDPLAILAPGQQIFQKGIYFL